MCVTVAVIKMMYGSHNMTKNSIYIRAGLYTKDNWHVFPNMHVNNAITMLWSHRPQCFSIFLVTFFLNSEVPAFFAKRFTFLFLDSNNPSVAGLGKRTLDSRGLHPSFSIPSSPTYAPSSPASSRLLSSILCGRGVREERLLRWRPRGTQSDNTSRSRTNRGTLIWRPSSAWRWRGVASLALLSLLLHLLLPLWGLRCVGCLQHRLLLDACVPWRSVSGPFCSRVRWWCRPVAPSLTSRPNEREGSLSALFPAPLHVRDSQPRCLRYSSLCFWVSLHTFLKKNTVGSKQAGFCRGDVRRRLCSVCTCLHFTVESRHICGRFFHRGCRMMSAWIPIIRCHQMRVCVMCVHNIHETNAKSRWTSRQTAVHSLWLNWRETPDPEDCDTVCNINMSTTAPQALMLLNGEKHPNTAHTAVERCSFPGSEMFLFNTNF